MNDLFASHLSGIGDIHGHSQPIYVPEGLCGHLGVAVGEGGVAQAMTKGEEHRQLLSIIVTVADEQPFAVPHLARAARPVEMRRGVGELEREGLGQLAAGVDPAKEDVGQRPATRLAHHPAFEDGRNRVDPGAHGHRRAVVEHDDCLGLGLGHRLDQRHLLHGQIEISAIVPFGFLVRRQRDVEQRDIRR